ncbi:MAG: NTP transferase domain-containing protein [Fimbriimonadales bacterium]|jgi:molybdopterin-guanine dinucleotide biosynthesis protein A|nr:NTP transferase domain-containing protein [Armatimonadota bacterium]MCX7688642.1 NTP transferase domain-containing protein [Fimbriimonadales bacterium]CUU04465.1 MobA-like NTP transferase domain-containing protein [Armatimonadetes bacterium GBS]CUU35046.1 MobA-like NTP transferase domain-containing protein [Armatimonadetes bacterium DC]CUU37508.1 MobA-like NTP transferase domain-containing protein [Armatimonadetes bacterium GXS]
MDAILIAGGHAPRRLAEVAGHSRKGLFSFGGMPLVQWVVRALLQAGFPRVAVVGSELLMQALPEDPNRVFFATEGRDPIDNLLRGAERLGLGPHDRFLHSAVDLPMITPEAVKDLLAHDDPEADLVAGLVPEAVFLGVYPGAPYRALSFQEGNFLNASVSIMRVGFLQQHAPLLHKLAESRKSLVRSLWHLSLAFHYHWFTRGLPALARFVAGRLSIHELPLLAERTVNARIRFYLSVMPELVYDVDTVEDYEYARAWVADQRRRRLQESAHPIFIDQS